jgi:hypothetical protein
MSLINEALKKARTAQPTGPKTATAAGPELHPVEAGAQGRHASIFTLPFISVLALMLAGIVFWAWHRAGRVDLVVRADTSAASANAAPSLDAPIAPPVTTSLPVATTPVAPAAKVDVLSSNVVTALEAPKTQLPVYRLDGIFFRPNRPSAVINGQIVYVGSRLEEAQVTAIDKESATIVTSAGQTNVLVLAN